MENKPLRTLLGLLLRSMRPGALGSYLEGRLSNFPINTSPSTSIFSTSTILKPPPVDSTVQDSDTNSAMNIESTVSTSPAPRTIRIKRNSVLQTN